MHPLPPGFEFRPYIDGVAVYMGEKAVAIAGPANHDPAPPWRISLNVGLIRGRYYFTANEEAARRYMAAWARKWAARIRQEHQSAASPLGHLARSEPGPQTTHIRGRSRQRSGIE